VHKKLNYFFIIAFVAGGMLSFAWADSALPIQAIKITTKTDPVRVGDLLPYSLAEGVGSHVDSQSGGIGKGFSLTKNGEQNYFVPLVPGAIQVPALEILNDAEVPVAQSEPFSIQVESAIPEAERQKPEAAPPIGPMSLALPPWLQSVVGFGILAILGLIVYFIIRRVKRRASRLLKKILPAKAPDVVALEALKQLEKKGAFTQGKHKVLFFGLSEILKAYLGARFHFDAVESTTAEMLEVLRSKIGTPGLSSSFVQEIQDLYEVLDRVKFTDFVPDPEMSRSQFNRAQKIVVSSREVKLEIR